MTVTRKDTPRLWITKEVRKDLDGVVEYRSDFAPREFGGFADTLMLFYEGMLRLGKKIDLTKVQVLHNSSGRAVGFLYHESN